MGRTSIRLNGVLVYVEPHERSDAIRDCLTEVQVNEISNAPETAIIRLMIDLSTKAGQVDVIEEG
jgi:hypothetical protein